MSSPEPAAADAPLENLLTTARERIRTRHLSLRTEQVYLRWMRRYAAFHGRRPLRELGPREIEIFLTHLAVSERVARRPRIRHSRRCSFSTGTYSGSSSPGSTT